MTKYAIKIQKQRFALNGLFSVISKLAARYAEKTFRRGASRSEAYEIQQHDTACDRQIAEAGDGIVYFDSCLVSSLNADCQVNFNTALLAALGLTENEAIAEALAPQRLLVTTKVWTDQHRTDLFRLCFRILGAFGDEFQPLIQEVRTAFPEETAGIT